MTQGNGLDVSTKTMEALRRVESLSGRPIRLLEDAIVALLEPGEVGMRHVQGGSDA
jgi:hypothetical protein